MGGRGVGRGEGQGAPALQPSPGHSDGLIPHQHRQMKHISAEQKRRFNIKMGFDTLNSLISNNSKLVSCPRAWRGAGRPAGRRPHPCLSADQPRHHAAEDGGVHHQAAAGARPDAGGGAAAAGRGRGAQRHHHVRRVPGGSGGESSPPCPGRGPHLSAAAFWLFVVPSFLDRLLGLGTPRRAGPALSAPQGPYLSPELPLTLPVLPAPASSCCLPQESPSPGASVIT